MTFKIYIYHQICYCYVLMGSNSIVKKSQFTIIWCSQNFPCLQKPAERLNPSRPAAIVACRQKGQWEKGRGRQARYMKRAVKRDPKIKQRLEIMLHWHLDMADPITAFWTCRRNTCYCGCIFPEITRLNYISTYLYRCLLSVVTATSNFYCLMHFSKHNHK